MTTRAKKTTAPAPAEPVPAELPAPKKRRKPGSVPPAERKTRKVDEPARQLIRQCIIAGLNDGQIRDALAAKHYPSQLSQQALWAYRNDPELKGMQKEMANRALQRAGARRELRVGHLSDIYDYHASRIAAIDSPEAARSVMKDLIDAADAVDKELAILLKQAGLSAEAGAEAAEKDDTIKCVFEMVMDVFKEYIVARSTPARQITE